MCWLVVGLWVGYNIFTLLRLLVALLNWKKSVTEFFKLVYSAGAPLPDGEWCGDCRGGNSGQPRVRTRHRHHGGLSSSTSHTSQPTPHGDRARGVRADSEVIGNRDTGDTEVTRRDDGAPGGTPGDPGRGRGGGGRDRTLPGQLQHPGQLPVQPVRPRVQPGVPARSVQCHPSLGRNPF